jgi:hypothetical protein
MTQPDKLLSIDDVEREILHEDKRGRSSHVYRQLLATMRENERLLRGLSEIARASQVEGVGVSYLGKVATDELSNKHSDTKHSSVTTTFFFHDKGCAFMQAAMCGHEEACSCGASPETPAEERK